MYRFDFWICFQNRLSLIETLYESRRYHMLILFLSSFSVMQVQNFPNIVLSKKINFVNFKANFLWWDIFQKFRISKKITFANNLVLANIINVWLFHFPTFTSAFFLIRNYIIFVLLIACTHSHLSVLRHKKYSNKKSWSRYFKFDLFTHTFLFALFIMSKVSEVYFCGMIGIQQTVSYNWYLEKLLKIKHHVLLEK